MKDECEFSVKVEQGDVGNSLQVFKNAVKEMRKTMTTNIEYQKLSAKLTKARYDYLIEEGFSEAQALVLCKDTR